ncbi:putative indole-3-acetic acid-amido synthetase GH3.3 [Hordeum vulgare]|nr:putative indole-3-acetic acid-amido synthetase GH3.3 [Hordeum vulgare]
MSTLLSGPVLRRGASPRLLLPVSRHSSQANGEAARTAKQSPGWGVGSLDLGGIEAGHGSSGTSRVEACRGVVSFVRSGCCCSITSGSSSSGTTQGKRKYLLFNEELVKSTMQIYRTSYAFRNRVVVALLKLHLLPAFFLWCQPPGTKGRPPARWSYSAGAFPKGVQARPRSQPSIIKIWYHVSFSSDVS